jgi:hypothetical protein
MKRLKGLEPSTFCMASRRSSQLSYSRKMVEYKPLSALGPIRHPGGRDHPPQLRIAVKCFRFRAPGYLAVINK